MKWKIVLFLAFLFILIILIAGMYALRRGDHFVLNKHYHRSSGRRSSSSSGSSSGSSSAQGSSAQDDEQQAEESKSSSSSSKKSKKHGNKSCGCGKSKCGKGCAKKGKNTCATGTCCESKMYNIGPVPPTGAVIANVSGEALADGLYLGMGVSAGTGSGIGVPPTSAQSAMNEMAGCAPRCGVLRNLTTSITVSSPTATALTPTVVRVAIWKAKCPDDTFRETALRVRVFEVTNIPTTFCLEDDEVCEPVCISRFDRFLPVVTVETADRTALITECAVGFEFCCADKKLCPCCCDGKKKCCGSDGGNCGGSVESVSSSTSAGGGGGSGRSGTKS